MSEKSQFGKGLIICLVKFSEHFMTLQLKLDLYRKMKEKKNNTSFFTESHAIEIWANGATDHLYEIEVPDGIKWDEIRGKVNDLQEKGLLMGLGFQEERKWRLQDVEELMNLTREISLLIDKKLGLNPDEGEF